MKKQISFILFALLSVNLSWLHAQISQNIQLNLSDLEITTDAAGYSHLFIKDTYPTTDVGKPELPVLVQSFILPADAEVTGIRVTGLTRKKINGSYRVFPAQELVPVSAISETINFTPPDRAAYNTTTPFPGKQVEIVSDGFEKGYHIVTVTVYPVEYIPRSGELYLCSFNFTIDYRSGEIPEALKSVAPASSFRQESVRRSIEYKVENKADIERFQSASQKSAGMQRSLTGRNVNSISPDYIIITNNQLKPAFQVLADWKTKKGVRTIIKTTEEISSEYPGCDLQEKIRNYLKQAHARWGEGQSCSEDFISLIFTLLQLFFCL